MQAFGLMSMTCTAPARRALARASLPALWLLVGILMVALLARLQGISALNLWFDEGIAVNAASQPTLFGVMAADPTNPPVYYLLLHASIGLIGASEFALRWLSVAIGLLLIPLAYQLARCMFGQSAGLYAALLTAVCPSLWWASREVRMYGVMAVLLTLAALAWWQLVNHPKRRSGRRIWLLLWGAELLLLYTHTTGPIAALWLNAVTLLVWLVRRDFRRPDWRVWSAGQGVLLVAWLPWLFTRFVLVPGANQVVATPPQIGLPLAEQIWQSLWSGSWEMVGNPPALATLSMLLFVLALCIIPWWLVAARWTVIHVLVLVGGLLAGLGVVKIGLHGRYLVMAVPLVLVLLPRGLAEWQRMAQARIRHAGWLVGALLAGPFLALSFISTSIALTYSAYQHDGVKQMVQYYADTLEPNDTVLAWSYVDRYELAYYWPRLGVRARRVTLPEGADADAVTLAIPATGRIALNVWFTQRADARRMMSCLLSNGSRSPPNTLTVYGMSNELYAETPVPLSEWQSADAGYKVARLTAVGGFPNTTAERALCLPVQITTTQPVVDDLKVAVIVKNALGWEIARADAVFARADQKTSSQLPAGETLVAYPLLWLPYGTPPGEYTVVLRLYDAGTLSGYDVLNGAGAPTGKDFTAGTWMVKPGADWSSVSRTQVLAPVNITTSQGLSLRAQSVDPTAPNPATNGGLLQVTLLWYGSAPLPELYLVPEDGRWSVPVPNQLQAGHDAMTLDWRQVRIPAEAQTGMAKLVLPDGTVLARYAITALPGQFDPPSFAVAAHARLPGVGELAGFTLDQLTVKRTEPLSVTLVWRAGNAAVAASYTAFVQLIGASGQLIAQSDAIPAQDTRPTTSWRPGEYIVDMHEVIFHADASPGPATLIVGLYDAQTGTRVAYADGSDAFTLPVTIEVR